MAAFPVRCENKECDLADFLDRHPGGSNYLTPHKNKDIYQMMCDTGHSKAAHYLLREFKLEKRENLVPQDDGDLEHLINWDKPILSQIGSLGSKYKEWVISPVVREVRLHDSDFLELISVTPWYVIPLIWLPIFGYLLYKGCCTYIESSSPDSHIILPILLYFVFGLGLGMCLEYPIHRWVFHFVPDGSSKPMIYIHFVLHGLHHKTPFDSRWLVAPPALVFLILCAIYIILAAIWPSPVVFLIIGGVVIDYILYDMIHLYIHTGNPKGGYFYYLKRYHMQHHFGHQDSAFGVTNTKWDIVFGTYLKLRTLKKKIRW